MHRRRYLAGLAGAAGPLAGCSGRGDDGSGAAETVTPVPVPGEGSGTPVSGSGVDPAAVGDAHVSALSGGTATVGMEYDATVDGEPYERSRVVATVDGSAITYRRFVLRPLDLGGEYRLFRGFWYDGGDAVTRIVEVGNRSVYRQPDDFTPPPAAERFHRDDLVATLDAYDPDAARAADGYRLSADRVTDPGRLPTGDGVAPRTTGRLAARLDSTGPLTALRASAVARTGDAPLTLSYRVAVTDRGDTTVERPNASETFEWYLALREASPVPGDAVRVGTVTAGDPSGMGEPPGSGGR